MKIQLLAFVFAMAIAPAGALADCKKPASDGVDWTGCTKKLLMLHSVNIKDAKLAGSNLTSTDLSGATLDGANLDGADLTYTSLKGASLKGEIGRAHV